MNRGMVFLEGQGKMNYSALYKEKIVKAYMAKDLTPEGAALLFDMTWSEIEFMTIRYIEYGLKGLTIKDMRKK